MKFSKTSILAAGVLSLVAASSALAATNLEQDTDGSIFVNVVDTSKGTAYLYDTGLKLGSFTGTASCCSVTFSDSNWSSFLSSTTGGLAGTDSIYWNVIASTDASTGVLLTTSTSPTAVNPNANELQSISYVADFTGAANAQSSSTTNSLYVSGGTAVGPSHYWGFQNPGFSANIGANTQTSIGSSAGFYKLTYGGDGDPTSSDPYVRSAFAGLWSLTSGGALSYTVASVGAVPLPPAGLLLLSALGLLGLLLRNRKSEVAFSGAAA